MAKSKKDTMQEDIFIGLDNPVSIRRALLESVKEVVEILQSLEHLKEIKKDKIALAGRLKETLKEVNSLLSKLKSMLPKVRKDYASQLDAIFGKKDVFRTSRPSADAVSESKQGISGGSSGTSNTGSEKEVVVAETVKKGSEDAGFGDSKGNKQGSPENEAFVRLEDELKEIEKELESLE